MKHLIFVFLAFLLSVAMPSIAALNEQNLSQSLDVLHSELSDAYLHRAERNRLQHDRVKAMQQKMIKTMRQADINAVMLYTQKTEFVFGLAYACSQATDQYDSFVADMSPLIVLEEVNSNEVARYDSLINVLTNMSPILLDRKSNQERLLCLDLAKKIKVLAIESGKTTKEYIAYYNHTERFLRRLNNYAEQRYKVLQDKMFVNGSETFYHILLHWDDRYPYLKAVMNDKFFKMDDIRSGWSNNVRLKLFSVIIGFAIIILLLNLLGLYLIRRYDLWKTGSLSLLRRISTVHPWGFVLTGSSLCFAIALSVLPPLVDQNFVTMTCSLLMGFTWLAFAVLVSSLIRAKGNAANHTIMLYVPLIVVSSFVILYRIFLFPNIIVNLTFPPVLIICALWHTAVMFRSWKHVSLIDRIFGSITQILFVAIACYSWFGFILISVQILIWWTIQLTCILVVVSLGTYLSDFGKSHGLEHKSISSTWFYYCLCMAVIPIMAIQSTILSAYWGGQVFCLTDMVDDFFNHDLVSVVDAIISPNTILLSASLWFVARYVSFFFRSVIISDRSITNVSYQQGKAMMYARVVDVLVYGIWLILAMAIMKISTTWIAAAFAGLATGLGFASKNILENIFYGVALLSGRLRIGDKVKIGDFIGKVQDINYSSTVILGVDGTIVTYTNTQLITTNYRNLTRSHEFTRHSMVFNIGLNEDIARVRQIIVEATSALTCLGLPEKGSDKRKYPIAVRSTGVTSGVVYTSIELTIDYWCDPLTERKDVGEVTECILNALRENNIKIV